MGVLDHLIEKLDYLEPARIEQIRSAYTFAESAHDGQYRRSGDPYITHPVAVASILADMHMDHHSIIAALLHDVIEDTGTPKEGIAEAYGETVAELVDGVSKISQMKFESKEEAQAENFRKMLLAMTRDIRVILVKLADRLHNMRTLHVLHPHKRRRIATETLDIYAPIANRLGMNNVRVEFEDLGFSALHPMRAELVRKAIVSARGHRKELLATMTDALNTRIDSEGIRARVIGREKHLFSVYQKMRDKRKSFSQIMDVYGFRIVARSVDECYRLLGITHNLYTPIPGRFKDYIAIPKTNGYQSLHTTLKGVNGVPVEIQIRTEEMEAMANNGIAAHWLYKASDQDISNGAQARARQWVKGLLEIQQNAGNSLEFIENVKIDLFPDEVYVFTPKGNILELPNGATPVDFAYAVHTDVGNSCVAVRVDHRLAPLSMPIQSGQTVQIITAPGARPNPAWLSFVITAKARTNIRHFLKNQKRSESVLFGQRLLSKALLSLSMYLDDVSETQRHQLLEEASLENWDDLLEDIGLGNRMAQVVARHLMPDDGKEVDAPESAQQASPRPLMIRGTEGMVVSMAKCCHPIPGDAIVGFMSSGRGMMIHQDHCNNISAEMREHPDKCLSVEWSREVTGEYPVQLRVEIENCRGALATIASSLTDSDANIENLNFKEKDARISVVNILILVKDRIHLAHAIKRLRTLKLVNKIIRVKS